MSGVLTSLLFRQGVEVLAEMEATTWLKHCGSKGKASRERQAWTQEGMLSQKRWKEKKPKRWLLSKHARSRFLVVDWKAERLPYKLTQSRDGVHVRLSEHRDRKSFESSFLGPPDNTRRKISNNLYDKG